jgi:hypothetical protein
MNLTELSHLRSLLAPTPRLYLHRLNQVDEPASSHGRRYWVVSRALCRIFKLAPLADASTARQAEALRLQTERLSPFAETGSHFHFAQEAISLWAWDARAVEEAAGAIGVDPRRVTVVPEAAMHPPGDGIRLIECLDGVEGQWWQNGFLSASRWWPAPPDKSGWILFQRGASIEPDRILTEPPPAVPLPWIARPWTKSANHGLGGITGLDPQLAAAVAAVVLLIGYGYIGAEWSRLAFDISAVERKIAAASTAIAPVTEARSTALTNQAAVSRLRELDPYPSQLALMARLATILPKNETHFTEWSYDRGQLEVTVAAAHPLDATYFVRALDRLGDFKAVSAERASSDNSLRIRLTVEPR